jgi:hypothetical protein
MTRTLIGLVAVALFAPAAAPAQAPPGTTDGDYEQIPVGGDVRAMLAITLGPAATFGAFAAGVEHTYTTDMTAKVISTAGDALLSVADPSSVATGHLVNGAFSLPQPLLAHATSAAGAGAGYAPVGGAARPTSLLTYPGPVSNDGVTIGFSQAIAASDALRTGTYSKTLTFTLSTTKP